MRRTSATRESEVAAVDDSGEMQDVPPDREMPTGAMHEQEPQDEQDEMPAGEMEPGSAQ